MLLLSNQDVAQVLDVGLAMRLISETALEYADGDATCAPRLDIIAESATADSVYSWRCTPGASNRQKMVAVRIQSDVLSWVQRGDLETEEKYASRPGLYFGLIWLFSTETGEPLALIHSGELQHTRAGARNGLSAQYLAREDSRVLAMVGSGAMARSNARAIAAVRPLEEIRVFSPTPEHREAFAREMAEELGIRVQPVNDPQAAVRGADIISLSTDSARSVIDRSWIEPGMHVNQTSGPEIDFEPRDEFDTILWFAGDPIPLGYTEPLSKVVRFAPTSMSSSVHYSTRPAAKKAAATPGRAPKKARIVTLADALKGSAQGRLSVQEKTFSGSSSGEGGIQGLGFIALAPTIYELAMKRGLGRDLPTEWFLQDVRD